MLASSTPDHEVAIVGAGFSGIGAAILLDRAGFSDYLMIEEGDGVGGAWHWNTYPGIAVDIPSFSYQFSFETRADWSRVYAPGVELKAYAEDCVDKYGVRDRIRFNTRVVEATFDETARPLATRDRRRGHDHRAARDQRRRRAVAAEVSGARRPRPISRASRCTPRAGTTPSTDGQAGRDHRHGRLGGTGDPGDRAGGREADRVSAHADLVPAQARPAAGRRERWVLERSPAPGWPRGC